MSDADNGENLVLMEMDGRTALITIDRPKALNALNLEVLEHLEAAVIDAYEEGAQVLVLTGAGKAFVAGADIIAMMEFTPAEATEFARTGQTVSRGR